MGFAAPWFLAAFAAVGLPVWLHLLRRHRSTPRPFASLMFFERRTQSSVKHRRLEHILLFALRTALLVLVALAFARPYITTAAPAAARERRVVLAIDNSFSMRVSGRLDRAKSEAAAAVVPGAQALSFASRVNVLTQPGEEPAAVRAAIASIAPSDDAGSYAVLVRSLRSLAESAHGPLEVHLFSDLQKTALPAAFADLRLPAGTRLVLHAQGAPEPNWAVGNIAAPRRVFDTKAARVQATIGAFGAPAATRRVSVAVNGKTLDTREVSIAANGRTTVEFSLQELPHGLDRGEVRIEPADALPADDVCRFAIERAEPRPVLFVHAPRDRRAALYFRAALEAAPGSPFRLEESDVLPARDLAQYPFLVLSDPGTLHADAEQALEEYVRHGGGALIALGPETRGRMPLLPNATAEPRFYTRDGDRYQSIAHIDASHPAVAGDAAWNAVRVFYAVRVESPALRVLARLADGTPLLSEARAGDGRALVLGSTLDNVGNDLPLKSAFVPFVARSAAYLSGIEDTGSPAVAGSQLAFRRGSAIEVLDPHGNRVLSLAEAREGTPVLLAQEGFYEVRRGQGRQALVAVNADRRESDLAQAPRDVLELWRNTGAAPAAGRHPSAAGMSRIELWPYLLALAAAIALAESLVGSRYLGEWGRPSFFVVGLPMADDRRRSSAPLR